MMAGENNALDMILAWYNRAKVVRLIGLNPGEFFYQCPVCHNTWSHGDTPNHYEACWIPELFEGY